MQQDRDSAKWYRQHAEELRAIAETYRDKEARAALLRIAAGYDQMAATRDRIDQHS